MPNDALPVGYIQLKMLHNLVVIIAGSARFRYVPLAPAAARWKHAHRRPTIMNDKDVEEALRIIRAQPEEEFQWDGWGQVRAPASRTLSSLVNMLAISDVDDAAGTVLGLLADGRLKADGTYKWATFRQGQVYWLPECRGTIEPKWWRKLVAAISSGRLGLVELHKVFDEQRNCPRQLWHWSNDRFAFASRREDVSLLDPDYSEEWFSASEINVINGTYCEVATSSEIASATDFNVSPVERNRGGAPQKYNWELAVAVIMHKWAVNGCWDPKSQADVVEKLAEHFAEKGQYPQSSQLKSRGRLIFEIIKGGEVATNSPIPSGPITQDQRGSTPF